MVENAEQAHGCNLDRRLGYLPESRITAVLFLEHQLLAGGKWESTRKGLSREPPERRASFVFLPPHWLMVPETWLASVEQRQPLLRLPLMSLQNSPVTRKNCRVSQQCWASTRQYSPMFYSEVKLHSQRLMELQNQVLAQMQ